MMIRGTTEGQILEIRGSLPTNVTPETLARLANAEAEIVIFFLRNNLHSIMYDSVLARMLEYKNFEDSRRQ
jgi:hypothetical protein